MTLSDESSEIFGLRWPQLRRLRYLEARSYWDGSVNRRDLADRFGVSINQASADFSRYQNIAPGNLVYDTKSKHYQPTDAFRPILGGADAALYLSELRLLAEGALPEGDAVLVATPPPTMLANLPPRGVEAATLRVVRRAIADRAALSALYQSMSDPASRRRMMEPHALAFDGFRWHMRAFCRARARFRDFVLARLSEARLEGPAMKGSDQDDDWHRMITITIRPHPGLSTSQAEVIVRDYGMQDGALTLTIRQAMLFYTLRRFGLDTDPDLRPAASQHIVLDNRAGIRALLRAESSPQDEQPPA